MAGVQPAASWPGRLENGGLQHPHLSAKANSTAATLVHLDDHVHTAGTSFPRHTNTQV
jgi:hypothetical protein